MLVNEPRFIALALTEDWDAAGNVTKRHRRTLTDLTDDQATEVVAACAKGWHEAGYEVQDRGDPLARRRAGRPAAPLGHGDPRPPHPTGRPVLGVGHPAARRPHRHRAPDRRRRVTAHHATPKEAMPMIDTKTPKRLTATEIDFIAASAAGWQKHYAGRGERSYGFHVAALLADVQRLAAEALALQQERGALKAQIAGATAAITDVFGAQAGLAGQMSVVTEAVRMLTERLTLTSPPAADDEVEAAS